MKIIVDLDDQADVAAGHAILAKRLSQPSRAVTSQPPSQPPSPPPSAAALAAQHFIDALWPHLGQSMRRLIKAVELLTQQKPMITIEELAVALQRDSKSVRASMNGPLAIAIKNVKVTLTGAPDLFIWQHNGKVYELGISVEIRNAVGTKPVF
jgi:hypothetical protein